MQTSIFAERLAKVFYERRTRLVDIQTAWNIFLCERAICKKKFPGPPWKMSPEESGFTKKLGLVKVLAGKDYYLLKYLRGKFRVPDCSIDYGKVFLELINVVRYFLAKHSK